MLVLASGDVAQDPAVAAERAAGGVGAHLERDSILKIHYAKHATGRAVGLKGDEPPIRTDERSAESRRRSVAREIRADEDRAAGLQVAHEDIVTQIGVPSHKVAGPTLEARPDQKRVKWTSPPGRYSAFGLG